MTGSLVRNGGAVQHRDDIRTLLADILANAHERIAVSWQGLLRSAVTHEQVRSQYVRGGSVYVVLAVARDGPLIELVGCGHGFVGVSVSACSRRQRGECREQLVVLRIPCA